MYRTGNPPHRTQQSIGNCLADSIAVISFNKNLISFLPPYTGRYQPLIYFPDSYLSSCEHPETCSSYSHHYFYLPILLLPPLPLAPSPRPAKPWENVSLGLFLGRASRVSINLAQFGTKKMWKKQPQHVQPKALVEILGM